VETEVLSAFQGVAVYTHAPVTHLRVAGKHRDRFIHNMTTCQVKTLQPGQSVAGLSVDQKGKLVTSFVLDAEESVLVLEGSPAGLRALKTHLEGYIVADRVEMGLHEGSALMSLLGPEADDLLTRLTGDAALPSASAWIDVDLQGHTMRIRRNEHRLQFPCWDITMPDAAALSVWQETVAQGATALGEHAWRILRVMGGVPETGVDMTDENIPLESAFMTQAIDWDKGCYIGQEVIARMHYRGKPNRHLMAVRLEGNGTLPAPQTALHREDGKVVGRIGTTCDHPLVGGQTCLAVILSKSAEPGQRLTLADGRHAAVVALPLPLPEL